MAKETKTTAMKGTLDVANLKLVEKDKEGERTYRLHDVLSQYEGQVVELTIKAVKPLETAGGA